MNLKQISMLITGAVFVIVIQSYYEGYWMFLKTWQYWTLVVASSITHALYSEGDKE
jgi:hypothetical protein